MLRNSDPIAMCNAANHPAGCDCGFGGDTGGGGWHWGSVSNFVAHYAPPSFGWAGDHGGTVQSYVNPNAHCPVCSAPVYFYRSPYNGRVFFDELGWPWPKHGCTDNRREPQKTSPSTATDRSEAETAWHREGWSPLSSPRTSRGVERSGIRGDCGDRFVDLALPAGTKVDRESPVLVRSVFSDIHQVTFLVSDPKSIRAVQTAAFDRRLLPVGDDALMRAAGCKDPSALYAVGRFLLWDLDDPESSLPYLQAATLQGSVDLLTLALFRSSRRAT